MASFMAVSATAFSDTAHIMPITMTGIMTMTIIGPCTVTVIGMATVGTSGIGTRAIGTHRRDSAITITAGAWKGFGAADSQR